MTLLLAASAFFLAIHGGVSGTPLRAVAVGALGENAYKVVYALASLLGIVLMGVGFAQAAGGPPLYDLGFWALAQTTPVTFVAFQLIVLAFVYPNPTSGGGDEYLAQAASPPRPQGIQHVTRHPFLWGMMLWSGSHLVANGTARALVLFGTFLLTAFFGTFSIDARRGRTLGPKWEAYAQQTSNWPFLALITGRTRFVGSDLRWWHPLLPLLFFGAFYAAHGALFGAPLPPR